MKDSVQRMEYITDYLTGYEFKIKQCNKSGLLDSAKMYELFALELCQIIFAKTFVNLNKEVSNYPYVDLVSSDNDLFVQVTTCQDINTKIKKTLDNLKTTDKCHGIKRIVFFVLGEESKEKIKNQTIVIRNETIEFNVESDIISISTIISKAQSDLDFQKNLFELLKKEDEILSSVDAKIKEALDISKNGLSNIVSLINNEYRINREDIIKRIEEDKAQFISVEGIAGCGKSALCKLFVEKEKYSFYIRAERYAEQKDINDVWGFNVDSALKLLPNENIYFFIDALEFISDVSEAKLEMLDYFYSIICKYPNAHIITSCRTSEASRFIRIKSKYNVKTHIVNLLNYKEVEEICKKYDVVEKMSQSRKYAAFVSCPFYLNMIISRDINIEELENENLFREMIWTDIICQKNKAKRYGLKYNEIEEAVNKIVFDRAKNFCLGIKDSEIDSNIYDALISEDIIIDINGYVRLKYDIYEDLCFENYFNELFSSCKGDYNKFFEVIEKLGRCAYRRYQIWVENKLFARNDIQKFIYTLFISETIPQKWKVATQIGIVRSKYCDQFFENYGDSFNFAKIEELISITNLYAFEPRVIELKSTQVLQLIPVGRGRNFLIEIIYQTEYYKNQGVDINSVIKLAHDYSLSEGKTDKENEYVCKMMTILEDYYFGSLSNSNYRDLFPVIKSCLSIIYKFPQYNKEYICRLWSNLKNKFDNPNEKFLYRDIYEWTLNEINPEIITFLPIELFDMINHIWFRNNSDDINTPYYESDYDMKGYYMWGLSNTARNYSESIGIIQNEWFIHQLLKENFIKGFSWIIDFINRATEIYSNNCSNKMHKITLISDPNREYYCDEHLWLAGSAEQGIPTIIGDMVYILKTIIVEKIKWLIKEKYEISKYADRIKEIIYQRSNNVALLTVIEYIGFYFEKELPGYCLDLISSIELVYLDLNRTIKYINNPTRDLLIKQMLNGFGLNNLPERYLLSPNTNQSLQEYAIKCQFMNSELRSECFSILDSLYEKIPNDKNNAQFNLQIQKMDIRNLKVVERDKERITFESEFSGEANNVVEENRQKQEHMNKIENAMKMMIAEQESGEIKKESVFNLISTLEQAMELDPISIRYHDNYIDALIIALSLVNISSVERTELCNKWLDLVSGIFDNKSYVSNAAKCEILFCQLNNDIDKDTANDIKLLLLSSLLYENNLNLDVVSKRFLQKNTKYSLPIFITILKLSEDEMNRKKHNAAYIANVLGKAQYVYEPNMSLSPNGVEVSIKENNPHLLFKSHKKEIIDEYLFDNEYEKEAYNISNCDVNILAHSINCGLTLNDSFYKRVIQDIINCIINIYCCHKKDYDAHKIINSESILELELMFYYQIVNSTELKKDFIDLFFDDIDFLKFTDDTIKMYKRVFSRLIPEFYDSYSDKTRRSKCIDKIRYLSQKIDAIKVDYIRIALSEVLVLYDENMAFFDLSKCKTDFSYSDKIFINEQFNKYGCYNLKSLLAVVYYFKLDKLLPEVLDSINNCFEQVLSELWGNLSKEYIFIIKQIIIKCYVSFYEIIRDDEKLTSAFESILEQLISLNCCEAAVLLDEFRTH